MVEWEPARIGDFVEIKHGFAFKGTYIREEPTENILVTPGNFQIGGGFKSVKFKYYSGKVPEEYILKAGDIIVTMTDLSKESDTLGYSARVPASKTVRYLHNQRIGLLQFFEIRKEDIVPDFIYWLMRTDHYQGFVVGSASGSSVMHTSPSRIREYEFLRPQPDEQKAIASVLSSLDYKIDLLHRQNKTLEAMAETLFRQWFVEEAQENWEEGELSNEFDFTMGQSPSGNSFNEEGLGIPMFQGNADFGFRFPNVRIYTTAPTRFAEPFDTLISVRAPVGAQNMAHTRCCIGRGLAAFRHKSNSSFYTYTYFKLRSMLADIKQFDNEGTVFGSISKSDFQRLKTTIPPLELVSAFETQARPFNEKVIQNCNQVKTLEKLRDTLLPKLMSGEVRVAY